MKWKQKIYQIIHVLSMHVLRQMTNCHKNSAQPNAQAKLHLLLELHVQPSRVGAKDIPNQHAHGI